LRTVAGAPGEDPQPSAGVANSQSVKTTTGVVREHRGYEDSGGAAVALEPVVAVAFYGVFSDRPKTASSPAPPVGM
jgi:hypothetical protein